MGRWGGGEVGRWGRFIIHLSVSEEVPERGKEMGRWGDGEVGCGGRGGRFIINLSVSEEVPERGKMTTRRNL
jgi:hypothetical protein